MRKNISLVFMVILLIIAKLSNASEWGAFVKGEGAKYYMKSSGGADAEISIYFTNISKDNINVEFFMYAQNTLIPIKLYQQFVLSKDSDSNLKLSEGYIKTPEMKFPQKLPAENLKSNQGIEMNDFLFANEKSLNSSLVETSKLKIMAGNITANHYRKTGNGQTTDFWISKEVRPLGLVKLISTGPKDSNQNYELELISILKNVKAAINPKDAKDMDEQGKALLSKQQTFK